MPEDLPSLFPESPAAERGILSSFLQNSEKVYPICVAQGAQPEWFSEQDRSTLFSVFMDMGKAGVKADFVTTVTWIIEHKVRFETPVPDAFVAEIAGFCPTWTNVSEYIGIVKRCAARKLAILACQSTEKKLREECTDLQSVHDAVTGAFTGVSEVLVEEEREDYDTIAKLRFLNEMEDAATGKVMPDLFHTFFPTIDTECGGMNRGEVLLIRGRKGCGKSLLGQSIIQQNALSSHARKSAIFTFEMPYSQVMRRLVASHGRVSLKSMKQGKYTKKELDSFRRATTDILSAPIRIYDTDRIRKSTPQAIFSSIRRQHKNEGLDMVMIDHLHILSLTDKRVSEKRTDELMHDFSRELKALSLELKIVSILLAQENTDGGTFGGTQVETDVDNSISIIPEVKIINGIKRIIGSKSCFLDKWREGNLLGKCIPIKMEGEFASIYENCEAVREEDF